MPEPDAPLTHACGLCGFATNDTRELHDHRHRLNQETREWEVIESRPDASGDDDRDEHGNWKPKPRSGDGWMRVLRHDQGATNDAEFYDPDGGHEDEHTTDDGVWLSLAAEAQAARREALAREMLAIPDGIGDYVFEKWEADLIVPLVLRVLGLAS